MCTLSWAAISKMEGCLTFAAAIRTGGLMCTLSPDCCEQSGEHAYFVRGKPNYKDTQIDAHLWPAGIPCQLVDSPILCLRLLPCAGDHHCAEGHRRFQPSRLWPAMAAIMHGPGCSEASNPQTINNIVSDSHESYAFLSLSVTASVRMLARRTSLLCMASGHLSPQN